METINKANDVSTVEEYLGMYKSFRSLLEEMEGCESWDYFLSVSKVLGITIAPREIYKSPGECYTKTREYLIDTLTRKIQLLSNVDEERYLFDPLKSNLD